MTRDRTREVKRPSDRPDRFGQDAAGADAGAHSRRAFALAGAMTLAKAGYVGEDVENSFPTCCSRPTTTRRWGLERLDGQALPAGREAPYQTASCTCTLLRKLGPDENPNEQSLPPGRPLAGHKRVCIPLFDVLDKNHSACSSVALNSPGTGGVPSPGTFLLMLCLHSGFERWRLVMGFGRGALFWLLGIPIPIILLLALFWHN
jgi:hypothetical protein